jgi:hypothetical protein
MNTSSSVRGFLCAALVLAAGSSVAFSQVEVVYAIESHAPVGHVKSQVPGNPGLLFRNFPRPYRSPDGRRWVAVATVNGPNTAQDQVMLVGSGVTGVVPALENVTLDNDGTVFAFGVNVAPRVQNNGQWITTANNGERIITGGLAGPVTVVSKGLSSMQAPTDVTFAGTPFSSANLTAAGPSFLATVASAPSGANKMGVIAATATVSLPIDVPTGQAGGSSYPMSEIDNNFFLTNAAGTRWMAQGKIANPDTGADKVLVVDGAVVIQEGSPLAGFTSNVSTISEGFMESNGDWYCRGSNADGTGWLVKNGTAVATTGSPVIPGVTETWTSFMDVHGNGRGDYAIVGRTNNADPNKSDIVTVNGRFVVARESDAVDLDGDGQREPNLFLHIAQNRIMFADDGYVYFASRLKASATGTTDVVAGTTSSSLLRVGGCPADIGKQGGIAGSDGSLDNNDFVVFIDLFFNHDWRADRGIQGGVPGTDGAFDNNDFVVYIDQFFGGC